MKSLIIRASFLALFVSGFVLSVAPAEADSPFATKPDHQFKCKVTDGTNNQAVANVDFWVLVNPPLNWPMDRPFDGYVVGKSDEKGEIVFSVPEKWTKAESNKELATIWYSHDGQYYSDRIFGFHVNDRKLLELKTLGEKFTHTWRILTPDGKPLVDGKVYPVSGYVGRAVMHLPLGLQKKLVSKLNEKGEFEAAAGPSYRMTRFVNVESAEFGTQQISVQMSRVDGAGQFDLRLGDAGTVAGTLKNNDGTPMAGVDVGFTTSSGLDENFGIGRATTNEKGEFRIEKIASGEMYFDLASEEDGEFVISGGEGNVVKSKVTTLALTVGEKVISLQGKAINSETSEVVSGASLFFECQLPLGHQRAISDENGKFEVNLLPGKTPMSLVRQDDFALVPSNFEIELDPKKEVSELTVSLTPLVPVVGTLIDLDKNLVPESSVTGVHEKNEYGFAITDAKGKFTIHLPKGIKFTEFDVKKGRTSGVKTFVEQQDPLVLRIEPLGGRRKR